MIALGQDTLRTRRTLSVGGRSYDYFSLPAAAEAGLGDIDRLPFSLKVLLENLLRFEDGRSVTVDDIRAVAGWLKDGRGAGEIAYRPARVLMQDFTGVPAVVDLAAMRAAVTALGGDAGRINPLTPVDLVIDHSVMVDHFGTTQAFGQNVALEMARNGERYAFLRWGQQAFENFRVVPPGTGICHQVNLEYLAQVVWTDEAGGAAIAYPDTLVGTDSHTTMVNGLAVLGWGVGGIEAEAAMLGQPISMLVPDVVGFKLSGRLREGATATDLVLTVTQMLRERGVVGKFVEFFGPGLDDLGLADRATIANMAPEYGATCGFFPIDRETITYLTGSAREPERIALVEAYARAQGMWREAGTPDPVFTDTLELDLDQVEPSIAGPKRPQDKIRLSDAKPTFASALDATFGVGEEAGSARVPVAGTDYQLRHGDVVIAAITSCTNTSNPSVMVGAGLLARNAAARGLRVKPWVKTSLAPGSKVVSDYLASAGLQDDLDALGFNLVGYGCTTCIGNSGPLAPPIADAVESGDLVVCSVLSGNRNFEGRISPHVKANYLASPPLVVAYAIAGSMTRDLGTEPLGTGRDGALVYLRDIWPTAAEVRDTIARAVTPEMFRSRYGDVFTGDDDWRSIEAPAGQTYAWDAGSTYVQHPTLLPGHGGGTAAAGGRHRRANSVPARRYHHHGPHLARRRHRHRDPRRRVPAGATDRAPGLQFLRRAARQPRRDDAGHLRQHPHSQRARARHRGRHHPPYADGTEMPVYDAGDGLPGRGRAACRVCGQGVRHRLVARLGSEGNTVARCACGDRRELRANPPLEPGGHGRAAAGVHRGCDAEEPGARRQRADRPGGHRRRNHAPA